MNDTNYSFDFDNFVDCNSPAHARDLFVTNGDWPASSSDDNSNLAEKLETEQRKRRQADQFAHQLQADYQAIPDPAAKAGAMPVAMSASRKPLVLPQPNAQRAIVSVHQAPKTISDSYTSMATDPGTTGELSSPYSSSPHHALYETEPHQHDNVETELTSSETLYPHSTAAAVQTHDTQDCTLPHTVVSLAEVHDRVDSLVETTKQAFSMLESGEISPEEFSGMAERLKEVAVRCDTELSFAQEHCPGSEIHSLHVQLQDVVSSLLRRPARSISGNSGYNYSSPGRNYDSNEQTNSPLFSSTTVDHHSHHHQPLEAEELIFTDDIASEASRMADIYSPAESTTQCSGNSPKYSPQPRRKKSPPQNYPDNKTPKLPIAAKTRSLPHPAHFYNNLASSVESHQLSSPGLNSNHGSNVFDKHNHSPPVADGRRVREEDSGYHGSLGSVTTQGSQANRTVPTTYGLDSATPTSAPFPQPQPQRMPTNPINRLSAQQFDLDEFHQAFAAFRPSKLSSAQQTVTPVSSKRSSIADTAIEADTGLEFKSTPGRQRSANTKPSRVDELCSEIEYLQRGIRNQEAALDNAFDEVSAVSSDSPEFSPPQYRSPKLRHSGNRLHPEASPHRQNKTVNRNPIGNDKYDHRDQSTRDEPTRSATAKPTHFTGNVQKKYRQPKDLRNTSNPKLQQQKRQPSYQNARHLPQAVSLPPNEPVYTQANAVSANPTVYYNTPDQYDSRQPISPVAYNHTPSSVRQPPSYFLCDPPVVPNRNTVSFPTSLATTSVSSSHNASYQAPSVPFLPHQNFQPAFHQASVQSFPGPTPHVSYSQTPNQNLPLGNQYIVREYTSPPGRGIPPPNYRVYVPLATTDSTGTQNAANTQNFLYSSGVNQDNVDSSSEASSETVEDELEVSIEKALRMAREMRQLSSQMCDSLRFEISSKQSP